ncbi:MAG: tetratricopeptide repeat protein [Acidobacteria bacterium]|nr:MAG: tetratricopeptide repeat protein [Acidobacteriota bacterium]
MSSRIETLRSFLEASPDDCFVRYGLAQEHVKAGADEAAIEEFQRILAIDPTYQAAYYHAGRAHQRLGQNSAAGDVFERGIEMSVTNGDPHARSELEAALAELPSSN